MISATRDGRLPTDGRTPFGGGQVIHQPSSRLKSTMRLKLLGLVVAIVVLPITAHAQLTIDMASLTCKQYLDMPPGRSRNFSSWMSGWFSYQTRRTFVDFLQHQQDVAKVQGLRHYHWNASVMSALKAAIGPQ